MPKTNSKELLELLRQPSELTTGPLHQPRGLAAPTRPPPADSATTPGVADSAEKAARREALMALVRRQQEELPIAAADQASRGAVAGFLGGLGFLFLRALLNSGPSVVEDRGEEYPGEEYSDEEYADE